MRPFGDLAFDQLAVSIVVDFLVAEGNNQRTIGTAQSVNLWHLSLLPSARFAPSFDLMALDQAKGGRLAPAPRRLSQSFMISGGANSLKPHKPGFGRALAPLASRNHATEQP